MESITARSACGLGLPVQRLARQGTRFGAQTVLSAGITLGIPALLHGRLGLSPDHAVAVAFAVALAVNFVVGRHFVFRSEGGLSRDLARFVCASASFRMVEYVAFAALLGYSGLNYMECLLVVLPISTALKFVTLREVVFKHSLGRVRGLPGLDGRSA